ncbi:hypothetical protein [Robbsia andropogonis]|nr:hypothetical protein [Robbsia andropogonis]MCP1118684.1 hypothetical protein [Robbsia andropogonis]MCP1128151.1 hypothetical protein [Robbsia andropogonis]
MKYAEERKEAILKKLLAPHIRSVVDVSREEGISGLRPFNYAKQHRAVAS